MTTLTGFLILHNNETFYYQIAFLRRVLSNDSLKEFLEIINGKYENNDFATKVWDVLALFSPKAVEISSTLKK